MTLAARAAAAALGDDRALIFAPSGRDARIAQALLEEAGLSALICSDLESLYVALEEGAALALVTDEGLAGKDLRPLSTWLAAQPPWSDFPFVLLIRPNSGLEQNPASLHLMSLLGNATFLERPFHPMTLVSMVRAALRARRRQYETRDHLLEREGTATKLREIADRLAFALRAGRLGSWELDVDAGILISSDLFKANFGRPPDEAFTYEDLLASVHPDDLGRMQDSLRTTLAERGDYDIEYRVVWPAGSVHWVQIRGRLIDSPSGRRRVIGVSLDITERKQAEERQWLLAAELDHRVKNMLAVIQSLISQTKRRATGLEDFAQNLQGRIQAVARTNNLLSRSRWEGASLLSVIGDELEPYRRDDGTGVRITNEQNLLLRPKAATALGMAVHELVTNAVKYGALSVPQGSVEISWSFVEGEKGRALSLRWSERGGPPVQSPERRGFGSVMIERTLAYEVDGSVRLDFRPEGLICEIEIPEAQLVVAETNTAAPAVEPSRLSSKPTQPASGKRILVVEDSVLVAMDVESVLHELGWETVGPANGLRSALDLVEREAIDGAVLDVNLGDRDVFPVADMLLQRQVPFVFATGYDKTTMLPARFQHLPTVQKPFDAEHLKAAVTRAFAMARSPVPVSTFVRREYAEAETAEREE